MCHLFLKVLPWSPSIYRIKAKVLEGIEDPSLLDPSLEPCLEVSPICLGWQVVAVYSPLSTHSQ